MSDQPVDSRHDKNVDNLENGETLMLWLMKHKDLETNLEAGVEYFKSKYGLTPNVVIIHPDDAAVGPDTIEVFNDIMVATAKWCLKMHCLVGIISSTDSVWGVPL